MAFQVIYARTFLEKVFSWPLKLQHMAFEAANHAALDPSLVDYKRDYLTPFRQKHPTTNHQYTLYFLMLSSDQIFFAWINDSTCLHDTRNKITDPCLKEFQRLQNKNDIEAYDPKFHKFVFEVHPNQAKPIRCRSRYLGHETTLNTYLDGTALFVGHGFYCDEPCLEIAKIHVGQFLNELHMVLIQQRLELQIQFTKQGHDHEIDLLNETHDRQKWIIVDDIDDFILKKI
jgi:hypothetical protein